MSSTARKHTPQWYIESDEVAESYKPKFEKMVNSFQNGDAIKLETHDTQPSYLYQRDDGIYIYWTNMKHEGVQIHGFHTFEDHPSLQLYVMVADTVERVPLEDSKLWHNTYGLKEPTTIFGLNNEN